SVRDRVRGFIEALGPSRREDGPASALSGPSFHLQATRPSALHRCTHGDCRLPRCPGKVPPSLRHLGPPLSPTSSAKGAAAYLRGRPEAQPPRTISVARPLQRRNEPTFKFSEATSPTVRNLTVGTSVLALHGGGA